MEADAQRAEAGSGNADRCKAGLHGEQAAAPAEGLYISRNESTKYGYLYFKYVLEPPKRKRKRAAKDGKG